MPTTSYFPLAPHHTPLEAELAAVQAKQRALSLDIEDSLARLHNILNPLPPLLEGVHQCDGRSISRLFRVIVGTAFSAG